MLGSRKLLSVLDEYFSDGEQQRVALARALVGGTGLILCDEPLSNFDADLRERMRVEISSLVRESGATAVYITHDQAEAFALADRIGLLQLGRLIQFGRPEEIYTQPASPFVARFSGLSGELPVRLGNAAVNGADFHLTGTVADVAFRGRGYQHAIDIRAAAGDTHSGPVRLTGVFAPVRVERGDVVNVRLDPAGCHVFPAEPSAAAGAATDPAEPDQPTAVPA